MLSWSVRSNDLIAIVNRHLSEGVRGVLWFVKKSFLKSFNLNRSSNEL